MWVNIVPWCNMTVGGWTLYHDCGWVNRLGVLAKSPLLVHKCFLPSRCTLFVKASEKYVFSQQSSVLLQQRERLGSRWLVCTLRLRSTLACTLSSTLSSATRKAPCPKHQFAREAHCTPGIVTVVLFVQYFASCTFLHIWTRMHTRGSTQCIWEGKSCLQWSFCTYRKHQMWQEETFVITGNNF